MAERKTLKSVSIDDVKPRVTLTPIVEVSGETCRIHHIKSDSIAVDGRDTFVPLRHVSKQKRRIFELESENTKLRELATEFYSGLVNIGHCLGMFHKCTNHACRNIDIDARCCRLQLVLLEAERMGIEVDG